MVIVPELVFPATTSEEPVVPLSTYQHFLKKLGLVLEEE
jgi:hypothetical protein